MDTVEHADSNQQDVTPEVESPSVLESDIQAHDISSSDEGENAPSQSSSVGDISTVEKDVIFSDRTSASIQLEQNSDTSESLENDDPTTSIPIDSVDEESGSGGNDENSADSTSPHLPVEKVESKRDEIIDSCEQTNDDNGVNFEMTVGRAEMNEVVSTNAPDDLSQGYAQTDLTVNLTDLPVQKAESDDEECIDSGDQIKDENVVNFEMSVGRTEIIEAAATIPQYDISQESTQSGQTTNPIDLEMLGDTDESVEARNNGVDLDTESANEIHDECADIRRESRRSIDHAAVAADLGIEFKYLTVSASVSPVNESDHVTISRPSDAVHRVSFAEANLTNGGTAGGSDEVDVIDSDDRLSSISSGGKSDGKDSGGAAIVEKRLRYSENLETRIDVDESEPKELEIEESEYSTGLLL